MGQIDSFADKQNLPDQLDQERKGFSGGEIQSFGADVPISRNPTPMDSFDKGISGGEMQSFGAKVDLDKTPRRGWESYSTPISKQTPPSKQSNG